MRYFVENSIHNGLQDLVPCCRGYFKYTLPPPARIEPIAFKPSEQFDAEEEVTSCSAKHRQSGKAI
jgi:hypothetical protein